jgi:hypothetical protein
MNEKWYERRKFVRFLEIFPGALAWTIIFLSSHCFAFLPYRRRFIYYRL